MIRDWSLKSFHEKAGPCQEWKIDFIPDDAPEPDMLDGSGFRERSLVTCQTKLSHSAVEQQRHICIE